MRQTICLYFLGTLLSGGGLYAQSPATAPNPAIATAQNPAPATAPKPASESAPKTAPRVLEEPNYVRRFSVGATLSVLGMQMIPAKSTETVTSSPPFDGVYSTTAASQRAGFGITAQLLFTSRFAVNASLLMRRLGYTKDSNLVAGTDDPNTIEDERTYTSIHEDTRAKLYDVPVTIRYYVKDRHAPGPRFFMEAGGVVRRIEQLRTFTSTILNDGTTTTDHAKVTPALNTVRGIVVGAGVQFIDPVGIRVVPGVRYTRWASQMFDNLSTATRRDQVEANISLTF